MISEMKAAELYRAQIESEESRLTTDEINDVTGDVFAGHDTENRCSQPGKTT